MIRPPVLAVAIAIAACTPPVAVAPNPASPISAGFSKTWNAVIDVLAEDNVPVKTLDRSSGFVVAELATMSLDDLKKFTSCGGMMDMLVHSEGFGVANYNILVRGDSTASTVKVTARFTHGDGVCQSTNVFESGFQSAVKSRAETGVTATH
jgi:hypothetical protein